MRELKHALYSYITSAPRRRTPHGVRELKHNPYKLSELRSGRTPHGVRELKHGAQALCHLRLGCRTPHGVRELKHVTNESLACW